MPQEGMLLQLDGSHHPWPQPRGPRFVLMLASDDATGTAPHALFREQEATVGYLTLLKTIVERHGIPVAVYTDRHAALVPREGRTDTVQVARALRELGVRQIFAMSPEAKGRVERANGTFQDRLVSELRLAGARTLEQANEVLWEFLPRFNARFGVPAAVLTCGYRPVESGVDIEGVFSFKQHRIVGRDNTVNYRGRSLQLLPAPGRASFAGAFVEVQERLDGSLVVQSRGETVPRKQPHPIQRLSGNDRMHRCRVGGRTSRLRLTTGNACSRGCSTHGGKVSGSAGHRSRSGLAFPNGSRLLAKPWNQAAYRGGRLPSCWGSDTQRSNDSSMTANNRRH